MRRSRKRSKPAGYKSWTARCVYCNGEFDAGKSGISPELSPFVIQLVCQPCAMQHESGSKLRPQCCGIGCTAFALDNSRFCSEKHATSFYELVLDRMRNASNEALAKRPKCSNPLVDITPAEIDVSKPAVAVGEDVDKDLELLKHITLHKSACGFDRRYFTSLSDIHEGCKETNCDRHRGWTEVLRSRIALKKLPESQKSEPNPDWVKARSLQIVPGIIRRHDAYKKQTLFFIPYIWNANDREYFLFDNAEPFWEEHC